MALAAMRDVSRSAVPRAISLTAKTPRPEAAVSLTSNKSELGLASRDGNDIACRESLGQRLERSDELFLFYFSTKWTRWRHWSVVIHVG